MTDHIFYDFAANDGHLHDIGTHMDGINSAKEDIAHVFNALGEVYEGEGAEALQNHHLHIHNALDDHMSNRLAVHRNAGEQQETMQALDRTQAADFS
jgi:uncharacterized protein YukE